MLFLPALSAACGLEAQEEIFPGNKFRYTELRLEGTLPVSGYPTPLYLFRRAARTQDGYVFDRSYTSVADGETLKLPLAELKAYDYRFLMVALPCDACQRKADFAVEENSLAAQFRIAAVTVRRSRP